MVRSRPNQKISSKSRFDERRQAALVALTLVLISRKTKKRRRRPATPKRNSILTGQLWLQELLNGHFERFQEQLGLSRHAFRKLSHELQQDHGLKDSRHITADEQLAIFLYFARHGSTSRLSRLRGVLWCNVFFVQIFFAGHNK
jgi:hypothetical protein